MQYATHKNFSREEPALAGSDRSFGFTVGIVLALLALVNWWHVGRSWPWTGGAAVLFLAAAVLYPSVLKPLNRVWLKFGLLLQKVVNPTVMGLMFFGIVLPTSLIMRAMHKDLLRLKFAPEADSYWIARQPPGPAPETMRDQF